jgi:hypothetical protein
MTPPGATFTGKPAWPESLPHARRDARDLTPSRLAILKRLYDAGGTVTVNGRSWPAIHYLTRVGFTAYVVRVASAHGDVIDWRLTDAGRAALMYRDARYK